jgi:biopolymer transport protein ExbD
MQITLKKSRLRHLSLVPLVDVMLILLVFFMVTSTYLDLNFLPVVERSDVVPLPEGSDVRGADGPASLLVRVRADGRFAIRGRDLDQDGLASFLASETETLASVRVILLPSGSAPGQALVDAIEAAAAADVRTLRVVRLEEGK